MSIGTPHIRGAGYFMNYDPDRGREEADIRTCTHCQAILKMQEWKNAGAWCHKCSAPICHLCGSKMVLYGCTPFVAQLDQLVRQSESLSKYLKDLGLEPAQPAQPIFTGLDNRKE